MPLPLLKQAPPTTPVTTGRPGAAPTVVTGRCIGSAPSIASEGHRETSPPTSTPLPDAAHGGRLVRGLPRSSRRPSLPLHGDPSASLCAPLASPRHQDRPRFRPETPARPPRSSACHRLKTQPSPLPLGLSSTLACAAAPRGTKPFFVRHFPLPESLAVCRRWPQ